jgi:hypothetical protein
MTVGRGRVALDRQAHLLRGLVVVVGAELVEQPHAARVVVPNVHAFAAPARRAVAFDLQQLGFDRADHALGDLVLYSEDIGEVAVVAFAPDMRAVRRLDELGCDAHPVSSLAHAAFKHITDAKLAAQRLDVDRPALVDETRVAGDHEEPAPLRQRIDDVLAYAVGEVILLCIATHVGEGQHRN